MKITVVVFGVLLTVTPAIGISGSQGLLKRYSPGNCGISLELPGPPELATTPPQVLRARPGLVYWEVYSTTTHDLTTLLIHTSATAPQSPKSVIDWFLGGVSANREVTGLNHSLETVTETKTTLKGMMKQNGKIGEINGAVMTQGNHSWLVVSLYVRSEKRAQAMGQRILDSIQLSGKSCPDR